MNNVTVVPHDPAWRDMFEAEAKDVAAAFGQNVIAVHHIGSTAIPGIFAKPVIDILVEVSDIGQVDRHGTAMEALGYEVMGEFGIDGRRYFRKDREVVRTHQIHVFEEGSDQVIRHLSFRDFMIAHPKHALEYSELKRRLADEQPEDPDSYMDGKDDFIKEMDMRAAAWRGKARK